MTDKGVETGDGSFRWIPISKGWGASISAHYAVTRETGKIKQEDEARGRTPKTQIFKKKETTTVGGTWK